MLRIIPFFSAYLLYQIYAGRYIITLNPKLAETYGNRCNTQVEKKNFDKGLCDCNRALALNSRFAEACVIGGAARYFKGDFDAVLADFNRAIEIRPGYATSCYNRGSILYERKEQQR